MKVFIDTHVLIWLYQRNQKPFSQNALKVIDESDLYFPSISYLELTFLFEIGKTKFGSVELIDDLQSSINFSFIPTDSLELSKIASKISWTRDPFDRMIVADAKLNNAKLLTKDRIILKNFKDAIW